MFLTVKSIHSVCGGRYCVSIIADSFGGSSGKFAEVKE